jgi:DNA processing protein
VPGNISSRNSFGTNFLIKGAGAKLIQQWQDVVAEFPPDIAAAILPPEVKQKGEPAHAQPRSPAGLSEPESALLKLIPTDAPAHIDALAERCGLPVQELSGMLLALEMRELIRQLPGRCYVRKL